MRSYGLTAISLRTRRATANGPAFSKITMRPPSMRAEAHQEDRPALRRSGVRDRIEMYSRTTQAFFRRQSTATTDTSTGPAPETSRSRGLRELVAGTRPAARTSFGTELPSAGSDATEKSAIQTPIEFPHCEPRPRWLEERAPSTDPSACRVPTGAGCFRGPQETSAHRATDDVLRTLVFGEETHSPELAIDPAPRCA